MGRPRKKTSDKRSVLLVIRVTKDEQKVMQAAAKKLNFTLSAWMREKLLVIAESTLEPDPFEGVKDILSVSPYMQHSQIAKMYGFKRKKP